jgi:anti-anti-sigma factor
MEISRKEEGGIVFVTIKGRLDADNALEAEKTVNNALEGDTNRILFDLGALDYLAAKEMKRRDGKMVLCSLTEFVKEIFEVSGFEALIPIEDSVDSGLKVLS